MFLLVFILYPGFTNLIFAGFRCRSLGNGESVLAVDYNIDCNSPEYASIFLVCSVLVVVWPLGLPVLLFYTMWKEKEDIHEQDRETLQKFNFCLGDYDREHWYWEVVELGRKLMLSGVIGLFNRGSVLQTVAAVVVAFVFFALAWGAAPFEEQRCVFLCVSLCLSVSLSLSLPLPLSLPLSLPLPLTLPLSLPLGST
jgi:hypothetical protein